MRVRALFPLLLLPALAACDSSKPPAPAASAPAEPAPVAVNVPAQSPAPAAAPVSLPASAAPILGSWAADLADCGIADATTTISAAGYLDATRSCQMALTENSDGSFALACGSERIALTPVFAPSGEGIRVVFGDGSRQTLLRCTR